MYVCTVDQEIFVTFSSSCVRKRTIYDGQEDHRRVSCTQAELSSLRHFGIVKFSALKNFRASNFRCCRPPTKYF